MHESPASVAGSAEAEIIIDLGPRSYPILLSHQWTSGLAADTLKRLLFDRPVCLISNETVWPLHGAAVKAAIVHARPSQHSVFLLPDGEEHKTPAQWLAILDHLASRGMSRDGVLIASGGGVVCDMTGFAAACWMRGIDFVQLPTTLLAQVDASVGGKTGINHASGKNLIGAFYQPQAVLIDTGMLATLPEREYRSGLAEAIKYGFILSASFVEWIDARRHALLRREVQSLNELVERCCRFKAQVVRADETEQGQRALLNLGHTFGHAIETLGEYCDYLHGEAVAIGMVLAARLSERLGLLATGQADKVCRALASLGLPVHLPAGARQRYAPERMVECMRLDKKVTAGRHRLVLLRSIGEAELVDGVPEAELLAVLREAFA